MRIYICISLQCRACVLSHVWLCTLMGCSSPSSSAHRIFQARLSGFPVSSRPYTLTRVQWPLYSYVSKSLHLKNPVNSWSPWQDLWLSCQRVPHCSPLQLVPHCCSSLLNIFIQSLNKYSLNKYSLNIIEQWNICTIDSMVLNMPFNHAFGKYWLKV